MKVLRQEFVALRISPANRHRCAAAAARGSSHTVDCCSRVRGRTLPPDHQRELDLALEWESLCLPG